MDINYCRYVVELAKEGSINQAAKVLFTSPQNLSRVIKSIESELNTELFIRSSSGMEATESGKLFIRFCYKTLADYNDVQNQIMKLKNINLPEYEPLTIYTTAYILEYILNDLLLKFKTLYPYISIRTIEYDTILGYETLAKSEEGIGIFITDSFKDDFPNIKYEELLDLNFGIVTSNLHPLAERKSISLNEIVKEKIKMLFFLHSDLESSDAYQLLGDDIVRSLDYDITSNSNHFDMAIKSSLFAGFVCVNRCNEKFRDKHHLSVIDIENIKTDYSVGIIYNSSDKVLESEKLFISFLKDNI